MISPAWLAFCAVTLSIGLAFFLISCGLYWVAQAIAVVRYDNTADEPEDGEDDEEEEPRRFTDSADFWKPRRKRRRR